MACDTSTSNSTRAVVGFLAGIDNISVSVVPNQQEKHGIRLRDGVLLSVLAVGGFTAGWLIPLGWRPTSMYIAVFAIV